MFDQQATLRRTLDGRLVAILRTPTADPLIPAMKAILAGGIDVIEITMTVPGALRAIEKARDEFGDSIVLGAGSVLDAETARACMLAGAEFIVSPVVRCDVIEICKRYGAVVMPGAMTPTEILNAWESGADVVKVFPANVVGGPSYIKAVKGPLPQVRLMPTGGVNTDTIGDFFAAGACAVGMGSCLLSSDIVDSSDWDRLRERSAQFVQLAGK
ncbi:MAG: bifunctional 4-hydroxy-2-oxoglutarate aldolase/2-dehydro-3-deoxy-phosphogluconate aldolase [Planctomycetaceae bacterium]